VIEYAVRARLVAVAAVTAIVGDGTGSESRVTVMHLPERPVWPCITIQRVSDAPEYDMEGEAGLSVARVQVDCWHARSRSADAYAAVQTLAGEVQTALSAYSGTVGGHTIQRCFLASRRPLYDDTGETHRESMDFMIAYS